MCKTVGVTMHQFFCDDSFLTILCQNEILNTPVDSLGKTIQVICILRLQICPQLEILKLFCLGFSS